MITLFKFLGVWFIFGQAFSNTAIDQIKQQVISQCSNTNQLCHTLAILDGLKVVINSNVQPSKPDGLAQYSCLSFGELSITLTQIQTGSDVTAKFDVGQDYDCTRFINNWKTKKAQIFGQTLIGICNNFGDLSKIKIDATKNQIEFVSKIDLGTFAECQIQEEFINSNL